ncbi:hypothetical protein F5X68DRAFT_209042 [Plectosphaerella plurivora]|uniref:Uncharacterized protein n=1 Tax=Plectosphaerella plurivora TaxID=936078 RepID=A0A9P8VB19_9PEZI|nr:hypothetical protein F5X68DRAFT_209042 [Plectosphaerella plurivora]
MFRQHFPSWHQGYLPCLLSSTASSFLPVPNTPGTTIPRRWPRPSPCDIFNTNNPDDAARTHPINGLVNGLSR